MSIIYDLNRISEETDFDEKEWDDLINSNEKEWDDLMNSDEVFAEQFSESIDTTDTSSSSAITNNKDIVKLHMNDLKKSTFINTNTLIHIDRSMNILIPPSSNQRVRYEKECKNTFRYITVPNNKTMTIGIPDLRDYLVISDVIWMRITRITINHRKDNLIFYHPYPIWLKSKNAKIHNGSIFIQITDKDMEKGFIEIGTLALIRLKQDELSKINTLAIYSSTQLDLFSLHSIEIKAPKRIRDEYKLQQSILNFQLVRVDQNNIAYPTDCLCQTESIHEFEANGQQHKVKCQSVNITKSKKINKKKNI